MFFGWQLTKAQWVSESNNLEKMVAGQYIYSLIHRELERETRPPAIDAGIGITCFSPLGGGLLTGKYQGQVKPEKGSRASFRTEVDGPRFWHPKGYRTAEIVADVSAKSGIVFCFSLLFQYHCDCLTKSIVDRYPLVHFRR